MKLYNLLKSFLALSLIVGFTACNSLSDDDEEEPILEYLVNYEKERSYLPFIIEQVLNQLPASLEGKDELRDRVNYSVQVYSIRYNTTFDGEPIVASGLVSVPIGSGAFPLLSYQNGTNTLHDNAPSVSAPQSLFGLLEIVATTGFVISMPDYLGFGSTDNMFHPYLHAGSTVPVVLDMLRAVEELGQVEGFSLNNDLYLTGYSMGGWATLQVQKEIENNSSYGYDLKASAPGAGPYDLNFVYDEILEQESYSNPYFLGFVFNSYTNLNEFDIPMNSVFNAPYDSIIPVVYNGSLSGEQINDLLTTDLSELFTDSFLVNRSVGADFQGIEMALEVNSIAPWNISTPTRLIHSSGDELVPFEVSSKIYNEFLEEGTNPDQLELLEIQNLSHSGAIIPSSMFAINWFFEIMEE